MDSSLIELIEMAIVDGYISDKEKSVILNKAILLGIDQDEVEIFIESKLHQFNANKNNASNKKAGIIKTCPACGASFSPLVQECKDCGYTLQHEALKVLLESIKQNPTNEVSLIRMYQVPSSTDSILEFISFSIGKIQDESLSVEIRKVWIAKFHEVVSIAKNNPNIILQTNLIADYTEKVNSVCNRIEFNTQTITNSTTVNDTLNLIQTIRDEYIKLKANDDDLDEDSFEKRICNAIDNIAIPSQKGEILNLLIVSINKGSQLQTIGTLNPEALAWNKKSKEIISKALILFSNDFELKNQLLQYEKKVNQVSKQNNLVRFVIFVIFVCGIVFWVKSCK